MSKYELLQLLKNSKRYMTEKQIIKFRKESQPAVNTKLRSLVKSKLLEVKKRRINIGKYNKRKLVNHYRYSK